MWIHSWLFVTQIAISAPIPERSFSSIHAQHAESFGKSPPRKPTDYVSGRTPAPKPQITVYGYHPYWGPDPTTLDFSRLTHLAIFNVDLQADGTLTDTDQWTDVAGDVVPLAHAEGVSVHLCITSFDDDVMASVLPDPAKRAVTIAQLVDLVDAYGADGVNVDFEGLDYELKDDFTAFIEELYPLVTELTIAMPAIDWNGSYDYDQLALSSDGLFIMGYDYHWRGGTRPVSPLRWGPVESSCLEWSVDDYRPGEPPETNSFWVYHFMDWSGPRPPMMYPAHPLERVGPFTCRGNAIAAEEERIGRHIIDALHSQRKLSSMVRQYRKPTVRINGLWMRTCKHRVRALGYEGENSDFWDMVMAKRRGTIRVNQPMSHPSRSLPVLTRLSPRPFCIGWFVFHRSSGDAIQYTWTQTRGPAIDLLSTDGPTLEVTATESGVIEFTLVVNDGLQDSAMDSIAIVVVEPNAGSDVEPSGRCGSCSAGRLATGSWLAGLMLLWGRLRRN